MHISNSTASQGLAVRTHGATRVVHFRTRASTGDLTSCIVKKTFYNEYIVSVANSFSGKRLVGKPLHGAWADSDLLDVSGHLVRRPGTELYRTCPARHSTILPTALRFQIELKRAEIIATKSHQCRKVTTRTRTTWHVSCIASR